MRVLFFSDLHARNFRQYSNTLPNGLNSRLQDTLNIINEISSLVSQYNIQIILFGGDLFHVNTPLITVTFNKIYQAISDLAKQVGGAMGLLVGNHDQVDKEGQHHTLETLKAAATVMDESSWYTFLCEGEELNVLAIPYKKDRDKIVKEIEHFTSIPLQESSILLGHIALNGAKMGANFIPDTKDKINVDELKPEKFTQIFLGHYHIQQQVLGNVRYIGATHHHNWGDIYQLRGVWLWDTPNGANPVFKDPAFIPLTRAPKFMHVPSNEVYTKDKADYLDNIVRVAYEKFPDEDEWSDPKQHILLSGARWADLYYEPPKADKIDLTKQIKDAKYQLGQDYEVMINQYAQEHYKDIDYHFEFDLNLLIEYGAKFYKQSLKKESG